ncbi:MAG: GT4 family glycosyltransferase PelF [Myxococcota bacterium]
MDSVHQAVRPAADIELVLEGTYPFVRGGVSNWVEQLIRNMPDIRFSILFIGSTSSHYKGKLYDTPSNVVRMQEHYLAAEPPAVRRRAWLDRPTVEALGRLHASLREGRPDLSRADLGKVLSACTSNPEAMQNTFLHARWVWDAIVQRYRNATPQSAFIDYFWTVRSMHAPLFGLARTLRDLPPARAYHTVSTGFAGLAGLALQARSGRPLILSEHGIYTKERIIELLQAEWLVNRRDPGSNAEPMRDLWIQFFEGIGRLVYAGADPILTLFEGNRERQVRDGAPRERTHVIPNGVEVGDYLAARQARPSKPPPVIALIGRVVPVKDVKTFIRTMRTVCSVLPEAEGWVVGPTEEDPGYAQECKGLVRSLGLDSQVRFLGFRNVREILPKVGLIMLSSISEAQPLVLLEGFAAGVPAVTTDVGCCRELLEGTGEEDRALGAAGAVAGISAPEELAREALGLLGDEGAWRAAQTAGIRRVERYYTIQRMIRAYESIYEQAMRTPWQASVSSFASI